MLPYASYRSETWPMRAENVKEISVLDHRYLRSIARVWWEGNSSGIEALCEALLRNWVDPNPNLMLTDELIEVVDKFVQLSSCVSAGGLAKDGIGKVRVAFVNPQYRWHRRDIS
ncbi:hypothetical protein T265_06940 [Opisthorchis viverrini]|uniref:Uncharacterized protein n=1 Tax=Opisthorchis viverrini TaxID=6198 RepID=A0A074ZQQ2_OPIVI|nr:hypothetical protein T265_06940 [Opisthorchis viverrini]KER25650.1 hypothetical protein T265_06940 [Opisthorchis viverrini]